VTRREKRIREAFCPLTGLTQRELEQSIQFVLDKTDPAKTRPRPLRAEALQLNGKR
jgi:hypothetical protein